MGLDVMYSHYGDEIDVQHGVQAVCVPGASDKYAECDIGWR